MACFHTFATYGAADTAAFAVLGQAPALPEGSLAFVITANPNADGVVEFAPLFLIRHVRWLNVPAVYKTRDAIVAMGHRIHVGGETSGPGDAGQGT